MSVLTTFIVKKYKPEPNRNLEKTNRNRTVSSEPWVTDISVNRGSPTIYDDVCDMVYNGVNLSMFSIQL